MKDFGLGFGYFMQGMRLITEPGLRWLVIIPLTLNIALFGALIYWAGGLYDAMVAWMMNWLPDWLSFLSWLLWLAYGVLVAVVFAYTFVAVANIVGAPFYGFLSEMVQKKLTGQPLDMEGGWKALVASIPRALLREVQKILYYLPRALGLLILGFIPVVNLIAALLWFVFSAWMMAVQYVDYPSDNNRQTFGEMRKRLGRQRAKALGFGAPVMVAAMIPVVNLIVVPAAVCGATVYWVRSEELSKNV